MTIAALWRSCRGAGVSCWITKKLELGFGPATHALVSATRAELSGRSPQNPGDCERASLRALHATSSARPKAS